MRLGSIPLIGAGALALGLVGCATTTFSTSWKAPDAQPLTFKKGDKVVTMVLSDSGVLRRSGEANLATDLDSRGLVGVPAYTLLSDADIKDEAKAKAAIEKSGAAGVVAVRPLGQEKEISSTPGSYYGSPYYGGFWGGYYGYGWGYDLRQHKLVWAGQTRTLNPSDVEGLVGDLAEAVAKELRAQGLLAPEK
jgi:hypothetical protein